MADSERVLSQSEIDAGPVVCPHCLAGNAEGRDFCHRCVTPLTAHAEIDPMGQIYAQGDAFRKAVSGPPKKIVMVGMWLIFGPALMTVIAFLYGTTSDLLREGRNGIDVKTASAAALVFIASTAGSLLYVLILFRLTRNYVRFKRIAGGDDQE